MKQSRTSTHRFEGVNLNILYLTPSIIRVTRLMGGYKQPRTWMLPDKTGGYPLEGLQRSDITSIEFDETKEHLSSSEFSVIGSIFRVTCDLQSKGAISISDNESGEVLVQENQLRPFYLQSKNYSFKHYLNLEEDEMIFGLGEKTGALNKINRRLRMRNIDCMGYAASISDPLYKHIPLSIHYLPSKQRFYALFYDNFSDITFDLGQEIDNYYGRYKSVEAAGGDFEWMFIGGPTIKDIMSQYRQLVGASYVPAREHLGYCTTSMRYTDHLQAQKTISSFFSTASDHELRTPWFFLGSGYCLHDGKRMVFEWNKDRFPDFPQLASTVREKYEGQFGANIKPCLLEGHPEFENTKNLCVQSSSDIDSDKDSLPSKIQFWDGEGHFLDFSNSDTQKWWKAKIKANLLDQGIVGVWNDNNEYNSDKDDEFCNGFGRGIPLAECRPLQALWMMDASFNAVRENGVEKPFIVTRSGCPGIHRYGQTWTGDNYSSWEALEYAVPMALGLGLSGITNIGHDIGGFAGPAPEPELLLRWFQHAVFYPRFMINSWNTDGSINEPWMYPELLPQIKEVFDLRQSIEPLIYDLLYETSRTGYPVLRPLFFNFPDDKQAFDWDRQFMLGDSMLVANVLSKGQTNKNVYLPDGCDWIQSQSGERYSGGSVVSIKVDFASIPMFKRV